MKKVGVRRMKIINGKDNFFSLVIPILGFVLYLGGTAIMKGFDAKKGNREKSIEEQKI